MFTPKKTKYRKFHKILNDGVATKANAVDFGVYGLVVTENVKITSNQLEAIRKVVSRAMKRSGVLYMRHFPHLPVTKKPLAVRMGGGKGGVEFYVAAIKRGSVLLELKNVSEDVAMEAMSKVSYKLPISCKFVKRRFVYCN
jgi:large subunit ribosomal protein L16